MLTQFRTLVVAAAGLAAITAVARAQVVEVPITPPKPPKAVTSGFIIFAGPTWSSFSADSLTRGTEHAVAFGLGIGIAPNDRLAIVFSSGGATFRSNGPSQYEVVEFNL